MKNLTTTTGKTEKEIKALYLSAIETLVDFGMNKEDARQMVKETFIMRNLISERLKNLQDTFVCLFFAYPASGFAYT